MRVRFLSLFFGSYLVVWCLTRAIWWQLAYESRLTNRLSQRDISFFVTTSASHRISYESSPMFLLQDIVCQHNCWGIQRTPLLSASIAKSYRPIRSKEKSSTVSIYMHLSCHLAYSTDMREPAHELGSNQHNIDRCTEIPKRDEKHLWWRRQNMMHLRRSSKASTLSYYLTFLPFRRVRTTLHGVVCCHHATSSCDGGISKTPRMWWSCSILPMIISWFNDVHISTYPTADDPTRPIVKIIAFLIDWPCRFLDKTALCWTHKVQDPKC